MVNIFNIIFTCNVLQYNNCKGYISYRTEVILLIEYLRKQKGFTQEDVARALGITLRQYINIEKGVSEPKIIKGLQLAAILEVDPYRLFNVSKP
jgi:DNA-binding XRE family transcriptional regulator